MLLTGIVIKMKFSELNLKEEVLNGIRSVGFEDCTTVQEKVLPVTLKGRDVMVQSKTGSGKTAVFLITIFEHYLESGRKSRAIVVAPTRELAVQIEEDAKKLSVGIENYKVGCFYGGVGYGEQNREIEEGLDLYVGTPGRLLDYAKGRKIDFRQFDIAVLDEADRMFDMGFYPDIQKMFSLMRDSRDRLTMLFSATLSTRVRNLAWGYMNNSEEILIEPEKITVEAIEQELFHVTKDEKFGLLLSILKKINPQSCLIFTNTKDRAVEVSKRLNLNGYRTEYLMGDMPQSKRLETIDRMKEGKLSFLVATDVAARGLQIDDLELVVNYDIPEDYENYVHRIGRTARAGKSGKAVTLACEEYIYGLEAIEDYIGMKIPVKWADEEGLEEVEDKSAGYRAPRRASSSRKPRESSRRSSSSTRDVRTKKPTFRDSQVKREKDDALSYRSKTDFNKLKTMSLEERMKYYQNAFSSSGDTDEERKSTSSPKNGKPQGERKKNSQPQKSRSQKPSETEKPSPAASKDTVQKPVTVNAPVKTEEKEPQVRAPEKKKGFFARIAAFFTGKKD